MRFLGKLCGTGTLANANNAIGPADYELDGYAMRPGAVVASGELRMASSALSSAIGQHGLRLVTEGGHTWPLRFTGKPSDRGGDVAHIDISDGLPGENEWRRLARKQKKAS